MAVMVCDGIQALLQLVEHPELAARPASWDGLAEGVRWHDLPAPLQCDYCGTRYAYEPPEGFTDGPGGAWVPACDLADCHGGEPEPSGSYLRVSCAPSDGVDAYGAGPYLPDQDDPELHEEWQVFPASMLSGEGRLLLEAGHRSRREAAAVSALECPQNAVSGPTGAGVGEVRVNAAGRELRALMRALQEAPPAPAQVRYRRTIRPRKRGGSSEAQTGLPSAGTHPASTKGS